MTTLKDIAKIAGVNISTVSKALRGSSDINEETRKRIIQIATESNYQFEKIRKKSSNEYGIIGIVCPEIISNYYAQIVGIIEDEARKEGYFCLISITNFDPKNEKCYLNKLTDADIDGIIFISENRDLEKSLLDYKRKMNVPLVLISQNSETKDFDCIKIDDDYGVRLAVEHLIQLGIKDIGYIGDELSNTRLNAFIKVLEENNLKINKKWIKVSKERFEKCGYNSMSSILKYNDIPIGILAAYDDIAVGVIKAIYDNGRNVPDDISVVGIDNIRSASYLRPELTTVAGPIEEMGKIAVKLLFKKIKDDDYNVVQNIRLTPVLIQRNSTKSIKNQKQ